MTTLPPRTTSPSPAQPELSAPAADWSPACVVFDCDGILMDTEANWARVQRAVAQRHGLAYTDAMERAMMGWSAADVATAIADAAGADRAMVHADVLRTEEETLTGQIVPLPGALETVREFAQRLPVAVASNSTRTILGLKLEQAGFAPHLSTWVSSEDVVRGKPAPDIYAEAVRRLGFAPAEALAVEDSAVGASSAVAAGLVVVAVPSVPDGDPVPAHHRVASLTDPAFRALVARWLG
ncbi:HAD-IA family hydrolase [Kocuria sediminis]|uniref:HAD-IA family hydrolase n=1 Tax=Kocuria sediminis TaxID=1038857 RepID=A0A6N8GIG5_9MICC|nr:HAD family phosphatase [Kocuria sediminis]MUN62047.1 HAD-IA family hydrolase [Kocuria sediminis]